MLSQRWGKDIHEQTENGNVYVNWQGKLIQDNNVTYYVISCWVCYLAEDSQSQYEIT